jgi:hypothetical protein
MGTNEGQIEFQKIVNEGGRLKEKAVIEGQTLIAH